MNGGNSYYRRSRISEEQFRLLIGHFADDLSATASSQLTGLTRKSVTTIFLKIRHRIAQECRRKSPLLTGKIERLDEHACVVCTCGRNGCGTSTGKPLLGLLCYENKIHVEVIPECKRVPLRAVIRARRMNEALLRNTGCQSFSALVDAEHSRPFKIAQAGQCKNIIDDFWSFSRTRLGKFNGVLARTFYLHLKECEWRFNRRGHDLYAELLDLLGHHPL